MHLTMYLCSLCLLLLHSISGKWIIYLMCFTIPPSALSASVVSPRAWDLQTISANIFSLYIFLSQCAVAEKQNVIAYLSTCTFYDVLRFGYIISWTLINERARCFCSNNLSSKGLYFTNSRQSIVCRPAPRCFEFPNTRWFLSFSLYFFF